MNNTREGRKQLERRQKEKCRARENARAARVIMDNPDRYFTGRHPATIGASRWDIEREETRQFAGHLPNRLGIPGVFVPIKIHGSLTGIQVEVRLSGFFTVISVDGSAADK